VWQSYFFFPALTFAHLARAAALILARPAAEMCRFGLDLDFCDPLRCIAHLARCAAAIRLRAAADIVRPLLLLEELPLRDVRAFVAASRRSRSCWSSRMIASIFGMAGNCSIVGICSLQLRVFGFGFPEDGDVGIGVFPQSEEVLISAFCFSRVPIQCVGSAKL